MASRSDAEKEYNILSSLKEGKRVECLKCHKGHYEPFNGARPDKAHYFVCNNCGQYVHFD